MELTQGIKELGLSDTEAKVYIALLKLKKCSVIAISKEVDIHRRSIYDNLNLLIKKGLVSYNLNGKAKIYEATNPENLKIILDEKQKILDEVFPQVKALYQNSPDEVKVNVYEGDKSLKILLEELMKSKEVYWIGGGNNFFEKMTVLRNFIEEKVSKMNIKVVQPLSEGLLHVINNKYVNTKNIRILPQHFKSNSGTVIYDNHVGFLIFQDTKTTTITINNKELNRVYKHQFDFLWENAKPFRKDFKIKQ